MFSVVLLEGKPPSQFQFLTQTPTDVFGSNHLPSTLTMFPGPVEEKQLQSMTLPPPCLTVEMERLGVVFSPKVQFWFSSVVAPNVALDALFIKAVFNSLIV